MIQRLLHRLKHQSYQRLESRSAYAKWAEDYPPTPHNLLMKIEQDSMELLMPVLRGKRVLDLACGTGRYGLLAQAQGANSVIGVDDSVDMLKQSPLANRVQGSMANIPLENACVDVVICGLAVGHYPDLRQLLSEVSRVLVDGGQAVVSDFHPFQYLAGARRTFVNNNTVYEVEHYPHLYETIYKAATHAGLLIDAVQEPTIEGQSLPVVLVYRLRKS